MSKVTAVGQPESLTRDRMAWLSSYTPQYLGTTSVAGICDRGMKPVSWTVQCTALVMGQRAAQFGCAVDELSLAYAIDDIVKAGCVRTLPVKSSVVPTQLETPPLVRPQAVRWTTSKLVLASAVQARYGFARARRLRLQVAAYEMDRMFELFARKMAVTNTFMFRCFEAWLLYIFDLKRATCKADILVALARFANHTNDGTTVTYNTARAVAVFTRIAGDVIADWLPGKPYDALDPHSVAAFTSEVDDFGDASALRPQALLEVLEGGIDLLQNGLDNMGHLWNSPMAETLKSMYVVLFAYTVNAQEGKDPSDITKEEIDRLRKTAASKTWYFTNNPVEFLARSSLFVAKAVVLSVKSRSWTGLLGDENSISTWALEANRLTSLATNLATLEVHGTSFHQFCTDLDVAINQGDIHSRTSDGFVRRECLATLSKLRILRNDTIARGVASKTRDPPFAVLFAGGTSLGKSSLMDMFYAFYAKTMKLNPGPEYKYPRNVGEEHWNNFRSSQWCIQFDEIAPLRPAVMSEVDPTTRDILGVCNSMPFSPPQASLDDKGKTPCLPRLVIGSTNVINLNTPFFFENPAAVMRRFHMIVEVTVKKEFAKDGGMLNYKLTNPEAFSNFWDIVLWKAVPTRRAGTQDRQDLKMTKVKTFSDIGQFLAHARTMFLEHEVECKTMKQSITKFVDYDLCNVCGVFVPVCQCADAKADACRTCEGECMCDLPDLMTPYNSEEEMEPEEIVFDQPPPPRSRPPPTRIPPGLARLMKFQSADSDSFWQKYRVWHAMSFREKLREFSIRENCANLAFRLKVALTPIAVGCYLGAWVWGSRSIALASYCVGTSYDAVASYATSRNVKNLLLALTAAGSMAWMWYRVKRNRQLGKDNYAIDSDLKYVARLRKVAEVYSRAYEDLVADRGLDYQISEEKEAELIQNIVLSPINQEAVWTKDDYRTTYVDVGRNTTAWAQMSREHISQKLEHNIARIVLDTRSGVAVCLGGNLWVTNSHFFRDGEGDVHIDFLFGGGPGVSQDVRKLSVPANYRVDSPETDTVFMWLPNMTPRKNIVNLLPEKTFRGKYSGFVMSRGLRDDPQSKQWNFSGASLSKNEIMKTGRYLYQWLTVVDKETVEGDCGSLAIAMTQIGPVILGFHSLGDGKRATYQPIWIDEVQKVTSMFAPVLLSGGRIMLPDGSPVLVPEIHRKSPLRFIKEGSCVPLGTFPGARAEPKTKVKDSPLRSSLEAAGWNCDFGPPSMKGWMPKHNALKGVLSPHSPFNAIHLRMIADEAAGDIISRLPDGWRNELGFVDMHVALNGIPGIAHMDRLNVSSSCGFPYGGPKKKFLADTVGDMSGVLTLDAEIAKQVEYILDCWRKGEQAGVVITAALKDEPRATAKILNHSTRMFQIAPMAFTIAMRMTMLPILRLFYTCHEAFSSAPGVDASSGEWNQLYGWLGEFENAIDGDFKAFDTLLRGDVMQAVYHIIHRVMKESGQYSPVEMAMVYAAVMECCYINMNFFGDVIQLFGVNSSGNAATVFFNCLANLIILRYIYAKLNPDGFTSEDFLEFVRLILYGDDNASTVSKEKPWFNFTSIKTELAKLGITYTPARKTEGDYLYKPLKDIEFLKRGFVSDPETGHMKGALNKSSIEKMVMVMIPSSSVGENEQVVDMCASAVREAALHGRDFHAKVSDDLKRALSEVQITDIPEYVFPTYDQLQVAYCEKSNLRDFFRGSKCPGRYKEQIGASVGVEADKPNQKNAEVESYCASIAQKMASVALPSKRPGQPPNTLFRDGEGETPTCVTPSPSIAPLRDEVKECAQNLKFQTLDEENTVVQESVQTTQFTTANEGETAGFTAKPSVDNLETAHLGEFLSRPVQIGYLLWTPATAPAGALTIYPWHEFFNNSYIKQKVSNFGLVRGNLRVRVLVNATQFVYGSAMISYWPLCGLNEDRTSGSTRLIHRSQRPCIWIDPSASKGGDLVLPFFYPRNWLELGSSFDMKAMGRLDFDVVATLASAASSANIDCSVQVYAWLENVELGAPTVGGTMRLQTKDEYLGPISGPASAIASAARAAKRIGRLATAAEIGSTAIAKMSSLFGYSNIPDLEGPKSSYLTGFPQMATVGQSYPVRKLALDSKSGLGASCVALGLDEDDQTSIRKICGHESYMGQFLWNPSQTTDTLLFAGRISPHIYNWSALPDADADEINMSPMCMVSKMFRFWRGGIILRFQFVCSPFHRGRLIISYDPTGDATTNLTNVADTTMVVKTYIVDLATLGDSSDFEVLIPYSQAAPWCLIPPRMDSANEWTHFGAPVFSRAPDTDNGTLTVRIQTELSSPSGTGDVPVLVHVRGAPDLEFGGPGIDRGQYLSYFRPQTLDTDAVEADTPSDEFLLNMGERVDDLRVVLQRRCRAHTRPISLAGASLIERYVATYSRTPLQYGCDPEGENLAVSLYGGPATTATYAPRTFLSWMWPHYVAHRGAIDYTVNLDANYVASMTVYRDDSESTPGVAITSVSSIANPAAIADFLNDGVVGTGGMEVVNSRYQPTTTVSHMMYHYNKFYPNNIAFGRTNAVIPADWADQPLGENTTAKHLDLRVDKLKIEITESYALDPVRGKIDLYSAAGTDFNFLWFIGCAPVWDYFLTPTA